jgi:TPR repeat protein
MNDLGVAYETGLGVGLDVKMAAKWYQAAAEQGNDQAQASLGQLYFDGRGVPYDLKLAYKWFKLSKLQGNTRGEVGFRYFENQTLLHPDELAEAEKMILEFRSKPAGSPP